MFNLSRLSKLCLLILGISSNANYLRKYSEHQNTKGLGLNIILS